MKAKFKLKEMTYVYIPPQAPGPGHACCTTSMRCSSVILPTVNAPSNPYKRISQRHENHDHQQRDSPYDSNASEILTGSPFLYPIAGQSTCRSPTCIVPPYTMIVGRLCRTAAIAQPGIFLSHPGRDMLPS